jgi:hypothetical protein
LSADPLETDPTAWPDLAISATILGGEVFELDA